VELVLLLLLLLLLGVFVDQGRYLLLVVCGGSLVSADVGYCGRVGARRRR
jgi:hypothetical protein